MASLLITHAAQLVTPCGHTARHGREMDAVRMLEDAALYAEDGIITAVGTMEELQSREAVADTVINAEGKCLLPGCVDSHTHFCLPTTVWRSLCSGGKALLIWN